MDNSSGNFPVLIDISILGSVDTILANILRVQICSTINLSGWKYLNIRLVSITVWYRVISTIILCVEYELFDKISFR